MSWFWRKKKEEQSEKGGSCETTTDVEVRELGGNGLHREVSRHGDADHDDAKDTHATDGDKVKRESLRKAPAGPPHDSDDDDADESSEDDETDDDQDKSNPPPKALESGSTDEDDVSMIDDSSDVDSIDDDFMDSNSDEEDDPRSPESGECEYDDNSDSDDSDEPQEKPAPAMDNPSSTQHAGTHQIEKHSSSSNHPPSAAPISIPESDQNQEENNSEETDDEEEVPTSFWEKQSLLVLAAEHDRVDILRAILTDEDKETEKLMNGGVPPLHLAITFGSVNTTQSLLRMGADPSVRPNVDEILKQQRDQPEDSKVEIANIRRFDGVSAWELAFGNKNYDGSPQKTKGWSLFGSSSSSLLDTGNGIGGNDEISLTRIIKPVDMPPSKREGVRHAFTAEALRCVGGDESDRLQQLVNSGMPATIDIGGKDLYTWAVEMGALQCEELLRPSEAAKYGGDGDTTMEPGESSMESPQGEARISEERNGEIRSSSFVIHRPAEETIPQLVNRLDELESLSTALSICLDNLAEEVSVCHGLLLMGGGASALASHVKSLKMVKYQKLDQLEQAQIENEQLQQEFVDLIDSSGGIGTEIDNLPAFNFFNSEVSIFSSGSISEKDSGPSANDTEVERRNLSAQIAASENKIRKLRSSIADLSEENARDLNEVERRGLEGGIKLVRGLREELRDVDFQLYGAKSMKREFRTKINMIHARLQTLRSSPGQAKGVGQPPLQTESLLDQDVNSKHKLFVQQKNEVPIVYKDTKVATLLTASEREGIVNNDNSIDAMQSKTNGSISEKVAAHYIRRKVVSADEMPPNGHTASPKSPGDSLLLEKAAVSQGQIAGSNLTTSEKIATGHSQALAVVQPGNRGFFTADLWQVLLRIMGYDRASYRRGMQVASMQPNVMIV